MQYLARKYNVLTLDQTVKHVKYESGIPQPAVALTFDDGYVDNYECVYPALKRYNIPATFFLTTGVIGTTDWLWTDKLNYLLKNARINSLKLDSSDYISFDLSNIKKRLHALVQLQALATSVPIKQRDGIIAYVARAFGIDFAKLQLDRTMLSWEEVEEMRDNGMYFGAHTLSHPILTQVPDDQARSEILLSKKAIEKRLGKSATSFAYPKGEIGDYNSKIKQICLDSGFSCACSNIPGIVDKESDLFELRRISGPDQPLYMFATKLALYHLGWLKP